MTGAAQYERLAQRCADLVVRHYSTSFSWATRALPRQQRTDVRNVYALVRLADEIVDGAAGPQERAAALTLLEEETQRAMACGYSSNPLVHAFAGTARRCGIDGALTQPFFASMRTDLDHARHDRASFDRYVHGSAEVVGLMCLRVLLVDLPAPQRERRYEELAPGARALGAAFQKINFLRDLGDDAERLGRRYFPGVDPARLSESDKAAILAEIDADLRAGTAAIAGLPPAGARAVRLAAALFADLAERLRRTPASQLTQGRVRVPTVAKVRLATLALVGHER